MPAAVPQDLYRQLSGRHPGLSKYLQICECASDESVNEWLHNTANCFRPYYHDVCLLLPVWLINGMLPVLSLHIVFILALFGGAQALRIRGRISLAGKPCQGLRCSPGLRPFAELLLAAQTNPGVFSPLPPLTGPTQAPMYGQ